METDKCNDCGQDFDVNDLFYGPCPYAEEFSDDPPDVVLCRECYVESIESI